MLAEALELVGSNVEALVDRLAGVSAMLVAVALLLHVGKIVARSRAWHNIASAAYPDEGLRYRNSLGAYLCGTGMNSVLPARPGELLKLALVKRKAPGTRYKGLLSTLLTESIFDTVMCGVVLALGIAVGWTSLTGSLASTLGPVATHVWIAGAALLAAAGGVWLARHRLSRRLSGVAAEVARGFAVISRPRAYLRTVVSWQLLGLALRVASIHFFLAAFHLPAGVQATLLVLAVQSAANLIPLTPNGLGTQQALLVVALGSGATASSIVQFGAGAQLVTAVGDVALALVSLALMTGSLRWRRLIVASADPVPEPAAAA